MRVGYVVKRYPRFSETFIVNEVLAHEAAGLELEIFALRPPADPHFQDMLARVRAPVTYLTPDRPKALELWGAFERALELSPTAELVKGLGTIGHREAFQACRLAVEARRRRITHFHAHFATDAAEVARWASRLIGVPYSVTAHAKDIYHESVDPSALRAKLTEASSVVTVSDFNARHLAEVAPEALVYRIYNGLDLTGFEMRADQARRPLILAVGRLVEKKGFDTLISACALLRDMDRIFRCRIVGAGEVEGQLRGAIVRHGLQDIVTLEGPRPRIEVQRLLQEASVFAAPCVEARNGDRDGLPTVLIEAMALGTPCVSTPVTGIPEALTHGETGLLVAERDPAALAAALVQLLDRPELRARLAVAARARVERDFDVVKNAAALRAVFRQAEEPAVRADTAA